LSTEWTSVQNMQQDVWEVAVQEHNKYRRKHGVQDVKGDPGMHEEAQKYADYLASTNRFEPTTKGKYGNNIATSLRRTKTDAVRDAVTRWYEKVKFYDYERGWFSVGGDPTATGSFTAIVWKSTTFLGVGISWSDWERQWIVVVFYNPPATRDEVRQNVLRPRSSA